MTSFVRQTLTLSAYLRPNTVLTVTKIPAAFSRGPKMPSLWTAITSCWKPFSIQSASRKSPLNAPEEPRSLPATGFAAIEADKQVEEEELPDYQADRFYPVQLGEVFHSRYQAIAKLGFGSSSTIWLARDLK